MALNPVISKLAGKLVVLASASPRRREILTNVGLRFEVVPSWFKETLDKSDFKAPYEYAVATARQKALEVAKRMPFKHLKTPDVVIAADTIVSVDGLILEKPVDKQDAYRMLSRLNGKEHSVFTGVAIVLCHKKESEEIDYQMIDFYEETKVKFSDISEDLLWSYIDSGEPMDKAGGYGIQALGGMLVEYVHGDFLNVVGFPLNHFCKQLDLMYNRRPSSVDLESASTSLSPPTNQAHRTQDQVKMKSGERGERPCALANSLSERSAGGEAELQNVGGSTIPPVTRRGPLMEREESADNNQGLQRMIELMDGFKASKALFTASRMRVFDVLQSRPGLEAAQLAQEIKASVKGTERLLEACVSLGLLESQERSHQKPVYENADLAKRFLLSDAPFPLQAYLLHCDERLWPLFSHLESAVREGTIQHEKAIGRKYNDLFQDVYYSEREVKLRFMDAMHSIANATGKALATAFDLSSFKTACDLGGCTGATAYQFTKAHPELSVTVFDLPAVVETSGHFRPQDVDNGVSFVAGDFFKDTLPKADLYILARILHDWSDEKVHNLLSRISDACTPGCGLLVSEIFLDEDRRGPSCGLLQALSMTEGKQRSAAEYSLLLKSHSFTTAHVRHTDDLLGAMLCIKE